MSAISHLYDTKFSSTRQQLDAGSSIKRSQVEHLTDIPCHLQAGTADTLTDVQGSFFKLWTMFCPVVDIEEGDKVTIDGVEYKVSGTEALTFGRSPHCEVILKKF